MLGTDIPQQKRKSKKKMENNNVKLTPATVEEINALFSKTIRGEALVSATAKWVRQVGLYAATDEAVMEAVANRHAEIMLSSVKAAHQVFVHTSKKEINKSIRMVKNFTEMLQVINLNAECTEAPVFFATPTVFDAKNIYATPTGLRALSAIMSTEFLKVHPKMGAFFPKGFEKNLENTYSMCVFLNNLNENETVFLMRCCYFAEKVAEFIKSAPKKLTEAIINEAHTALKAGKSLSRKTVPSAYAPDIPEHIKAEVLWVREQIADDKVPLVSIIGAVERAMAYEPSSNGVQVPEGWRLATGIELLVAGALTGCCQRLGGAGESTIHYTFDNPDKAFELFRVEKVNGLEKIIGSSWIVKSAKGVWIQNSFERFSSEGKRDDIAFEFNLKRDGIAGWSEFKLAPRSVKKEHTIAVPGFVYSDLNIFEQSQP